MAFLMDDQTFSDLEIFGSERNHRSVFRFFDRTTSHGGKSELVAMFQNPLSDAETIKRRQEMIRYLRDAHTFFFVERDSLDFIEFYLKSSNKPVKISLFRAFEKAFRYWLKPGNEYYVIRRGIVYIIELLQKLYAFVSEDSENECRPELLNGYLKFIEESIRLTEFSRIITINAKKRIGPVNIEKLDYTFRYGEYNRLRRLLNIIYQIDALQSVADAGADLGFVLPEISGTSEIRIEGLYHPFLKDPVANDAVLDREGNLFFITGANMSGKSTFLKAFGTAVYLAHLGFPVAAASMQTGVFNGLFSTINIADNLTGGYSHFYTEVLRVKEVAKEINRTGKMVVIFDELFRGTNVKDAHDASSAIISAFAKVRDSMFLVSTHIMEVAENLRGIGNIRFGYFHTEIVCKTPVYNYQLKEGVTEERLGMFIVENERIIEIIAANTGD